MRVGIIKDWDWPDLLRQTPGGTGLWDGMEFTLDPTAPCDVVVMLNNRMGKEVVVNCPAANLWMLVQEPYCPGVTDWVVEGHSRFARVFTHLASSPDRPDGGSVSDAREGTGAADRLTGRYIPSQPALPWHVNRSYDQLLAAALPEKNESISWIMGDARDLPGHLARQRFFSFIRGQQDLPVALFGRAIKPIADKWEALAPYHFSLAVENNSGPHNWTEKLADCFLTWTVPFYFGCTNLGDYFPGESFIRIDITDHQEALATIRRLATRAEWERRLPAIVEARRLVLEKYQLFPHLVALVRQYAQPGLPATAQVIPPYRRSPLARLRRLGYKVKKGLGLL